MLPTLPFGFEEHKGISTEDTSSAEEDEKLELKVAETGEAEDKALSALFGKLLRELDDEVNEDWRCELTKIKCDRCEAAVVERGCGSFVYCTICSPLQYFCVDCKDLCHLFTDHSAIWESLSLSKAPLKSESSGLFSKGAAFYRVAERRVEVLERMRHVAAMESASLHQLVVSAGSTLEECSAQILEGGARAGRKWLFQGPLKHLMKVKHAGAIIPVGRVTIDLVSASWKWYNGDIDESEVFEASKSTVLRNTGLFTGSLFGKKVGAVTGFYFFGPIGAAVGGITGAAVGGYAGERFGSKVSGEKEVREKELALMEAAQHFNFVPVKVLDDCSKFNYEELRKRWKSRALELHPDRATGNEEKFKAMNFYYGLLLSYLDKRDGGDGTMIEEKVRLLEVCLETEGFELDADYTEETWESGETEELP